MKVVFNDDITFDNGLSKFFHSPAFLFGEVFFTSGRIINGKAVFEQEHIKRLDQSFRVFFSEISCDKEKQRFHQTLQKVFNDLKVKKNNDDNYFRVTVFSLKENLSGLDDLVIWVKTNKKVFQEKALKITTKLFEKTQINTQIKFSDYKIERFLKKQVIKDGYDDFLKVTSSQYVVEASTSNVFFIKDRQIFYPAITNDGLNGITKREIIHFLEIQGWEVIEKAVEKSELANIDGCFLTNAFQFVLPVEKIGKKELKLSVVNQIKDEFLEFINVKRV